MQTEQFEMLKTVVDRILSDVKALNPLVIDQIHAERTANFLKYPVVPNQKNPMISGWTEPKQCRRTPYSDNYGVITGEANNLIVLDIDNKNEGFEEFEKYVDAYGLPNTYTISTPGRGLHLYFNYNNPDENDFYLIENHLPSASGYRGKGIDIKNKGGGVVGPGSIRNGISYEVINNSPIIDMPSNLIIWLVENRRLSEHKRTGEYIDNSAYNYIVGDDVLKKY